MTPLADLGFESVEQAIRLKEVFSYKKEEDFVLNMVLDNNL